MSFLIVEVVELNLLELPVLLIGKLFNLSFCL